MDYFEDPSYILNHTLRPMNNLVLLFPTTGTMGRGAIRAWAFKVTNVVPLKIQYREELPDIIANTAYAQAFGAITRTTFGSAVDADDFFYVSDDYPFLLHDCAMGIAPEKMWVYHSHNGTRQRVIFPDLELTVGDKHDYIDGVMSPLDAPRVAGRFIACKNLRHKFSFYNDDCEEERPSLNFIGSTYSVAPYIDEDRAKKIINGVIPRAIVPVGGLREFQFTKPAEWPDAVELEPDELTKVFL